jgi:AcrR family transcriptional regulator
MKIRMHSEFAPEPAGAVSSVLMAKSDQPGRRETNRRERMARIKRAARQLFKRKGYDGTTLQMIGEKAGLGTGTLFGYLKDKRDLVWMLFEDDHADLTARALATLRDDIGFVDQSVNGFRPYYEYFARNARIAAAILREWDFLLSRSKDSPSRTVRRHLDRILKTIAIARSRGEITTRAKDEQLAVLLFHIYQMESRIWMSSPKLDVEAGLKSLRAMITIVVEGFGRDSSVRPSERKRKSLVTT